MKYHYPSILRRYFATLIDGMLVLAVFILISYILQGDSNISISLRVAVILFMFFVYEPICTSRFCTLGQKLTGIRVRKQFLHEKISIPAAYFRIIVKVFLGIISFFSIPFSKNKRGIHDFAVGSVVIFRKPLLA
jgi:uncharacterized RDD family membrane protein YckC